MTEPPDWGLTIGMSNQRTITVRKRHMAPHVPVFSTPALLELFERTSSEIVREHVPEGMTNVGFEVNIRHLAPAPLDAQVTARSEITRVDGKWIHFKVVAHYGETKIGEGTYSCAIVPKRFSAG